MLFIFLSGLIIGSFINCLIWRLYNNESLWGRSYCPKCKKQIFWYDNIPVLSFIILRGKCRSCSKSISLQYPLIELSTGILFVLNFIILNFQLSTFNFQFSMQSLWNNIPFLILSIRNLFIIAIMIIVFIYDMRWYLVLDKIVLSACLIVFILNLLLGISWLNLLISGIIGSSFFLIQFIISKGKWIGGGDIRLGLLIGLIFGRLDYLVLAVILAYFIGSITGIVLITIGKKTWGSQVPLGIFLSISVLITLFWGEKILSYYFSY